MVQAELERLVKDVREALMVARNTDGKLVSRPLSPHVQVYRWPLSMALSILHRASGVALGVGTLLMTWWLIAAASSDAAFASAEGFIGSPIGLLLLFGWTLALFFHLFSGVRHLVWDAGFGFDAPDYNTTGRAVVIATVVSTVLVWVIGLAVW
jgi:succinate dehydrogenase / fumarate reductase cytochrome b subunit